MAGNRESLAVLIAFSLLAFSSLNCRSFSFVEAETRAAELPPMSLTVIGANGTEILLNETVISGLPSYRGYGGFKNQLGNLKGLGNYTGVPLTTICSLVGGMTNESVVRITASDESHYSMNFTYAQVNGEFVTYDNTTGAQVPHSQPLVPLAAYYFNDASINSSNGEPLRLAIVGPEGLVTDSVYWVKWMVKIEILDQPIPEFPTLMVLPLLVTVTLAVALSGEVLRKRQGSSTDQSIDVV